MSPYRDTRKIIFANSMNRVKCELVPLSNKVRDYCEGDDGNTIVLVEFNEVKSLAILDSGS